MCFVKKNLKHIILFDLCYRGVHNDGCCGRNQRDFGKIKVSVGTLSTTYKTMDGEEKTGVIGYKLYVPKTATPTDKSERYYSSTAIRTIGKLRPLMLWNWQEEGLSYFRLTLSVTERRQSACGTGVM